MYSTEVEVGTVFASFEIRVLHDSSTRGKTHTTVALSKVAFRYLTGRSCSRCTKPRPNQYVSNSCCVIQKAVRMCPGTRMEGPV